MDEKTILQYSKDLTLNYLNNIKAEVTEQEEIYFVSLPLHIAKLFGGESKRITFNPEIASTHACDLAVPGSNFLSIVLREIQKQAPVITGKITNKSDNIEEQVNKIETHNCKVILDEHQNKQKTGIRFYFHVNLKSIKSSSSIRWTDFELDSLESLPFSFNLEFEESKNLKLEKNDKRFDDAYSRAIEEFEKEIEPRVEKYVGLTEQNKKGEIVLLDAQETKRLQELRHDLANERMKLKEFDRKISRARNTYTMSKYATQKSNFEKKLTKTEEQTAKHIQRIAKDKETSLKHIEQKYKPSLEFSLLAAQVYSFNVSDCILTLENGKLKKQIKSQYIEPTSSFITKCEICQNHNEMIHLCQNSHVSCDECAKHCLNCEKDFCLNCKNELNPCYICKDGLCTDCSKNCEFCSEVTCLTHSIMCTHCSKFTCYFCSDNCQFCKKQFCNNAIINCSKCKYRACQNDSNTCEICAKVFCINHQNSCSICSKLYCQDDTKNCKTCKIQYSSNCVSKNQCVTCSNLTSTDRDNPKIKMLIEKYTQYQKHKKWEFGENNDYLVFKAKKFLGSKTIIVKKDSFQILGSD